MKEKKEKKEEKEKKETTTATCVGGATPQLRILLCENMPCLDVVDSGRYSARLITIRCSIECYVGCLNPLRPAPCILNSARARLGRKRRVISHTATTSTQLGANAADSFSVRIFLRASILAS